MAVGVGLMGFGRIGRNLFRILYKHDDIQIVAISDRRVTCIPTVGRSRCCQAVSPATWTGTHWAST